MSVVGAIWVLSALLGAGALVVQGQADAFIPRQVRVPLDAAGPGASAPAAIVAALRDECPRCEIDVTDGELIASGPAEALSVRMVLSAVERHGYRWETFSIGRDFDPRHLARRLVGGGNLGWLLLPMPVLFLLAGWRLRATTWRGSPPLEAAGTLSVARQLALGVAGGLVLVAAGALVADLLARFGLVVTEQAWVPVLAGAAGAPRLVLLLATVVAAPIGEELFFRGWVLPYLQRTGPALAVLVSAALFAVVHVHPPALPVYFLFGIGLALLYLRTGSLLAPIVAHAINNLAAVIVLLTA